MGLNHGVSHEAQRKEVCSLEVDNVEIAISGEHEVALEEIRKHKVKLALQIQFRCFFVEPSRNLYNMCSIIR